MIVVAGGIKGGSGKTTVATNLAVMRAMDGKDVLLVDADDQETSMDFTVLRNSAHQDVAQYTCIKLSGPAVRTEVLRMTHKYDDIIIDTGGRDTTSQRAAIAIANYMLVPFVPRSFDVWTIEKVSDLVAEMRTANAGLIAYSFLNRADPRGQDNDDTAVVLRDTPHVQFVDITLGARKAFSNAAAQGLAVVETKPQDPKAIEEITKLYRYLFDII